MGAGFMKSNLFDTSKQRTLLQDIIVSGVLPKESPDKSASTIFDTGKSPFVYKHPKFAGGDVSHRLANIGGSPPIKGKHTPLSLSIIHQGNQ